METEGEVRDALTIYCSPRRHLKEDVEVTLSVSFNGVDFYVVSDKGVSFKEDV